MEIQNKPAAPFRVRITGCSKSTWWYADAIEQEFDVNDPGPRMDFVLWDDYCAGASRPVWRHIAQQDCELIKTKPPCQRRVRAAGSRNTTW